MSALGSLVVKLALEYAEYTKGLDKSDQAALKFAQRAQQHFDTAASAGKDFMSSMVTGAVGAVAAVISVNAALDSLNRSVDNLAQLDDLNQKTGASVENLSRLQQVASAFGHDFAGVDSALAKLAKGMAAVDDDSNKTNKALRALGVSAKDSAGKLRDPSEVFVEAAKRLAGYEDGAAKAALVTDLLGKSGADLLPYMNDVAESVDKFQGASAEAAANASKFQDQLGMTRAKFEALVSQIAAGALPAMNDLVEVFTESAGKANDLAGSDVTNWADDLAVGLARVVDVAQLLPRLFSAISGSFKVVGADISFAAEVMENANPVAVARKVALGGDPIADIRKALAERNAVLEDANKKWDDLWNKPANELEQAMLKRIADRKSAGASAPAGDGGGAKAGLSYGSKDSGGSSPSQVRGDYEGLNKALQQRLALAEREIALGRSLSASEKELAGIIRGRAEGTVKLTDDEFALLAAGLAQLDADQRIIAGRESLAALNKQLAADSAKAVQDAINEAVRNEALAESIGLTTAEIESAGLARLEAQLAQRSDLGLTLDEIQALERLIDAKRRSSAAASRVEERQAAKKSLDELNAFLDPAKAKSFGNALRDAFGTAGGAMSKLTSTLEDFGQRQAEIAKQRGNAANAYLNGLVTEKKYMEDMAALSDMETKNRLAGYGDMASAAAGFFGEQSKGYQALMAVSKVFHAAELAMTLAELVPKGIAAVLNQGTGDPYTAFGRMAAMAAIVTGLGVAIGGVGGGGGGQSAKDRQAAVGSGSVLGDSKAKSDSIAEAMELLADNSDIELSHTAGMLDALRSIESNIAGLGNLLVRSGTLTGDLSPGSKGGAEEFGNSTLGVALTGGVIGLALDKMTGGFVSKVLGKTMGAVFGGKVTTVDTGLTADRASLSSILADGFKASQYTETKKDGGWFRSDKVSVTKSDLGAEANDQFTKIIASLAGSIQEAGKLLGINGDAFTDQLNSFVVDIGLISLKDLKGEDIQKELEAAFAKLGDDMAQHGVAGLEQFQQIGEGYFETLTRIASNYANLNSIMDSIGSSFGATGMASLEARERLLSLAGGIDSLAEMTNAFAEGFLNDAERLAPVQKYVSEQMAALGYAQVNTADQFKKAVLDLANSGALATEEGARTYAGLMKLAPAFKMLTDAAAEQAEALDDIARQRADLESQIFELTHSQAEVLQRQRQKELEQLDASLRPLQERIYALQDEHAALDRLKESERERMSVLLGDVDSAYGELQSAVERERRAISLAHEATMRALQGRIDSVTASVQKLRSVSSLLGSTLDQMTRPGNGLAERAAAQANVRAALAIAKAGGPLPSADSLKKSLGVLTKDASSQFASYVDYLRDFYETSNDLTELSKLTDQALSVEERTLEVLNEQKEQEALAFDAEQKRLEELLASAQEQIGELKGVNKNLLTLSQAIQALSAAIASAQANSMMAATASINSAYKDSLGRAPDAAGLQFWQGQVTNGVGTDAIVDAIKNSPEAKVKALYQSVLGRTADAGGLQFYMDAMSKGASADDIARSMRGSSEYQVKVPAFATGGITLAACAWSENAARSWKSPARPESSTRSRPLACCVAGVTTRCCRRCVS
jgi:trimeric autotransporter adhesin